MPAKEIEIPVAFPDRRQMVVTVSPKGNVLDLKRKICKADAVEVIAAGDNADLLGKRYTAPATFRLICRGLELNNTGTLEYYHLTTKGRQQQAIRVVPKHDSLVDEEEIMNEDYSVPETVAHLEDEIKQKQEEEEAERLAAKKRQQTFHQKGSKKRGSSVASSAANSPSKARAGSNKPPTPGAAGGPPNAALRPQSADQLFTSNTSLAARSAAGTPFDRANIPTPDPTNPNKQLDMSSSAIEQQQKEVIMNNSNPNVTWKNGQRHHLPPMGDVTQYSHQQGLRFKEVVLPNSPSRGLAPMPGSQNNSMMMNNNNNDQENGGMMLYQHHQQGRPGAALFALPLEDSAAPMTSPPSKSGTSNIKSSGNSPDIIRQMKSYLRAAEKGDAPLPHVMPLPSAVGLTPPRNRYPQDPQNEHHINNHQNMMLNIDTISSACDGSNSCAHAQKLQQAELRIQQLESTVDRYKNLLHRLTQIENGQKQIGESTDHQSQSRTQQQQQQQSPSASSQPPKQQQQQQQQYARTPVQQRSKQLVKV